MSVEEDIHRKPVSIRLLSTFKLSEEVLTKLKSKGFTLKSEIENLSDSRLKSICGLNDYQIEEINRIVRNSHKLSLKFLSSKQIKLEYIHTGSHALDRLLKGGLPLSNITQIFAEGGAGKTQICMQCCVNVQFPPNYGGLSGQALYIDTENSVRVDRIVAMAEHRLTRRPELRASFSVESIKSQIFIVKCTTNSDDLFNLVINRIEPFIDSKQNIKLLVIDSIAQLFRYDYQGTNAQKCYQLTQIAQKLRSIAHSRKLAVLIANQVSYDQALDLTVPSLGKHWQTECNTNVFFRRLEFLEGNPRKAELKRTNQSKMKQTIYFAVNEIGVTDCVKNSPNPWHPNY